MDGLLSSVTPQIKNRRNDLVRGAVMGIVEFPIRRGVTYANTSRAPEGHFS